MIEKNNKKSQITIFVIISLIILVAIALLFIILGGDKIDKISLEQNPAAYIERCLKDSLERTEKLILDGNGYLDLSKNYMLYYGEKVPYLCSSSQFYVPCVNQEPMFFGVIKKEFEINVKRDVEVCFKDISDISLKKGYEVIEGNLSINVTLVNSKLKALVNKELVLKKNEETRRFSIFIAEINSPIYNLINTARIIVNFESAFCEFNNINWMKAYRQVSIKRFITSDQTKVYTLEDRNSGKTLSFAIKTCVMPAGI